MADQLRPSSHELYLNDVDHDPKLPLLAGAASNRQETARYSLPSARPLSGGPEREDARIRTTPLGIVGQRLQSLNAQPDTGTFGAVGHSLSAMGPPRAAMQVDETEEKREQIANFPHMLALASPAEPPSPRDRRLSSNLSKAHGKRLNLIVDLTGSEVGSNTPSAFANGRKNFSFLTPQSARISALPERFLDSILIPHVERPGLDEDAWRSPDWHEVKESGTHYSDLAESGLLQKIGFTDDIQEVLSNIRTRDDIIEFNSNQHDFWNVGKAGEEAVKRSIVQNGYQIVGQQVYIRNRKGELRIIDFLVTDGKGGLAAIEVKANGGVRSARQIRIDEDIFLEGGIIKSRKKLRFPQLGYGSIVFLDTVDIVVEVIGTK